MIDPNYKKQNQDPSCTSSPKKQIKNKKGEGKELKLGSLNLKNMYLNAKQSYR